MTGLQVLLESLVGVAEYIASPRLTPHSIGQSKATTAQNYGVSIPLVTFRERVTGLRLIGTR